MKNRDQRALMFKENPTESVGKNTFDLSHGINLSYDMGQLIPFLAREVIPGDTWNVDSQHFVRFAPMVAPIMTKVDIFTHYYFVPNRITWDNWEEFITSAPEDPNQPIHPYIDMQGHVDNVDEGVDGFHNVIYGNAPFKGSLGDYLGLPTFDQQIIGLADKIFNGVPSENLGEWEVGLPAYEKINPFPVAAYRKIYHDYYMDQNVIGPNMIALLGDDWWKLVDGNNNGVDMPFTDCLVSCFGQNIIDTLVDGSSITEMYKGLYGVRSEANYQRNLDIITQGRSVFNQGQKGIYMRAWEHDYFTSMLPFPQKGIDVYVSGLMGNIGYGHDFLDETFVFEPDGDLAPSDAVAEVGIDPSGHLVINGQSVKLDSTQLFSFREFRQAYALQKWLEKNARGGTRYQELIYEHFGVNTSDARLQRAEYLGGGRQVLQISEVLQTSQTETTAQGTMSGHGIAFGETNKFNAFFEEHGWVIGIVSTRPRTAYAGGLERHWSKSDIFDYYWKDFAHLGEQEVKRKELRVFNSHIEDFTAWTEAEHNEVIGYLPMYSELKYISDRFCGDFKDNLDFWHLGRNFNRGLASSEANPTELASAYTLNRSLIECCPDLRIFAVSANYVHHVYSNINVTASVQRPIPFFSKPELG